MQVESWECDLKVPNLPAATLMPGAALLGQAYYDLLQYTRHTIVSQYVLQLMQLLTCAE